MNTDHRSIPELLKSFANDLTILLRQEVRLARTETREKLGDMTGAIAMLAGAAVIAIPGFVLLLQAIATMLMANGMEPQWALLIVGAVVLAIGAILLMVGLARLKTSHLSPDRTLHQIGRDAAVAKEQIR
jgi:Putative Actinobacterial Holin-X, holin superfamily III